MNNKYSFSGLGANLIPGFQSGMKALAKEIGADFHALMLGYLGWRNLADRIVKSVLVGQTKTPIVLCGHSNGVYAALKIAEYLGKYKIPCVIVSVDKTLKRCPPAGKNVIYIQDHHATLTYVQRTKDCEAIVEIFEYDRPKGFIGSWHVGVSSDTILHKRVKALLVREGWM